MIKFMLCSNAVINDIVLCIVEYVFALAMSTYEDISVEIGFM